MNIMKKKKLSLMLSNATFSHLPRESKNLPPALTSLLFFSSSLLPFSLLPSALWRPQREKEKQIDSLLLLVRSGDSRGQYLCYPITELIHGGIVVQKRACFPIGDGVCEAEISIMQETIKSARIPVQS
jgi:hypothetical protein